MSGIITACVYAVVCAGLILMIRSSRPEFTLPLICASGIGLLVICIDALTDMNATLSRLTSLINSDYIKLLLKAAGICCIGGLSGDMCRDCGMTSIASKIDALCRIGICALAVPLLISTVGTIADICGV